MPFEEDGELRTDSGLVSFALIAVGLVGTFLGGIWVVGGAKTIADILGVSGTHIGLTLIPLGTSLPELTVSYAALKKNRPSIAISNVIGSNIFNILGILGVVGFITPMPADSNSLIQMLIAGIALLALPVVLLIRSKRLLWERYRLARLGGALLLASYMIYQIILFNL
jgi:cation:H+ antiporter